MFFLSSVTFMRPIFDIHLRNISCCKCQFAKCLEKTSGLIVKASFLYVENILYKKSNSLSLFMQLHVTVILSIVIILH